MHAPKAKTTSSATAKALLGVRQAKRVEDALEIVVAIIFNFDPAPLLAVMHQHTGAEMFLQPVLQILDCGGGGCVCGRLAPAAPSIDSMSVVQA